jgi:putative multiple sugar transport system ATP-binding protein
VVGIAGLMGSGRTELAMSIFGKSYGAGSRAKWMNGAAVDVSTVDRSISAGLAYVTEDRKHLGLVLDETIQETSRSPTWRSVSVVRRHLDDHRERKVSARLPRG